MTTPPNGNDRTDRPGDGSGSNDGSDNPYAAGPTGGQQESPYGAGRSGGQSDSPYGTGWHSPDNAGATPPPSYQPGGSQPAGGSTPSYGSPYQDSSTPSSHSSYPSYGYGGGSQEPLPQEPKRNTNRGFFSALFDLNFDNFVSVKYAKFIYTLLLVLIGLAFLFAWLLPALTMFSESVGFGFVMLLLGWIPIAIVGLFQLIIVRIILEFVISSVKTADNTSRLVDLNDK